MWGKQIIISSVNAFIVGRRVGLHHPQSTTFSMYSKSCDPQTETGVRFVTPSTRTKTNKRRVKATMNKHLLVYLLLCIGTLAFSLLHGHGLLRFHAASTEDAESHSFLPLVDVHPKVLSVNKTTSGLGLGRPTILWGIPTTKAEGSQRNLLRNTYLRYYRSFDLDSSPNRICSLADIKKKRVELGHCQVAYVFFMGANPDGPTELVAPNFSFPIEIDPSTQKTPEEDVVYLNIKENMEDGKSQTWFKYGAMMAETHGFDYIAKVDSDSLIFIPRFLEYVDQTMLPKPYNVRVFGGIPFHDDSCELGAHDTHACPLPLLGPYYFSGELYFMSPDLAAYIASDQVDRQNIAIYHEDVDIGNYVFSHPEKITAIPIHRTWVLRYPDINANFTITDDPFNGTLWAHTP